MDQARPHPDILRMLGEMEASFAGLDHPDQVNAVVEQVRENLEAMKQIHRSRMVKDALCNDLPVHLAGQHLIRAMRRLSNRLIDRVNEGLDIPVKELEYLSAFMDVVFGEDAVQVLQERIERALERGEMPGPAAGYLHTDHLWDWADKNILGFRWIFEAGASKESGRPSGEVREPGSEESPLPRALAIANSAYLKFRTEDRWPTLGEAVLWMEGHGGKGIARSKLEWIARIIRPDDGPQGRPPKGT